MTVMQAYAPGAFCWADLATTDADAAKAFYTDLLGWEFTDWPIPEGSAYTMFARDGASVAALYAMSGEMRERGVPAHWQSYVSVDDVDAAAAKAVTLGGVLVAPPFDVMDAGRMAVVRDPTGAVFSLWRRGRHFGAERVNEPGALCWNELYTRDTATATTFYEGLFGWSAEEDTQTGGRYTLFRNGERPNGGMMAITDEMGDVPPHWAVYFAVESCDDSVARAKAAGATLVVGPMDAPEVGRFAFLRDPQGAVFAVIALTQPTA